VIGDVVEFGQHVPLAARLWEEIDGLFPLELVEITKDDYDAASKTTRIWGDIRKGRATPRDRIIVLRRVSGRATSAVRGTARFDRNDLAVRSAGAGRGTARRHRR
jgi:hypothetical protein